METNANQLMLCIPWASVDDHMSRERSFILRASVLVLEVVDHLLDPDHAGTWESIALHERLPDLAIGSRIDIDREGRQRCLLRFKERSFYDLFKAIGIGTFDCRRFEKMRCVLTQLGW